MAVGGRYPPRLAKPASPAFRATLRRVINQERLQAMGEITAGESRTRKAGFRLTADADAGTF